MIEKINRKNGQTPSIQELADKLNETIEFMNKFREEISYYMLMLGVEAGDPIPHEVIKKKAS